MRLPCCATRADRRRASLVIAGRLLLLASPAAAAPRAGVRARRARDRRARDSAARYVCPMHPRGHGDDESRRALDVPMARTPIRAGSSSVRPELSVAGRNREHKGRRPARRRVLRPARCARRPGSRPRAGWRRCSTGTSSPGSRPASAASFFRAARPAVGIAVRLTAEPPARTGRVHVARPVPRRSAARDTRASSRAKWAG